MLLVTALLASVSTVTASAQEVPHQEYLRFLPLAYPRLIRQQPATAEFSLFGDPNDPGWRDDAPRDGIDDRRQHLLLSLATLFAPLLVPNTGSLPLDARQVMEHQDRQVLHVDRWDIAGPVPRLVTSDTVDLAGVAADPCPSQKSPPSDTLLSLRDTAGYNRDCRLVELLRRFDPTSPTDPGYERGSVPPHDRPFTVVYVDTRGGSPREWLAEYLERGRLRGAYREMVKSYVHPFVHAVVPDSTGSSGGYELVLQCWFFYAFNNGGNNHEGDWEHVNVVVSPRSLVAAPLSASSITG